MTERLDCLNIFIIYFNQIFSVILFRKGISEKLLPTTQKNYIKLNKACQNLAVSS